MTNINDITIDMAPQEKEIYFSHQEMRHRQEQEKLKAEKQHLGTYKEMLIKDILDNNKNFTKEELKQKPIRVLEKIFDNI